MSHSDFDHFPFTVREIHHFQAQIYAILENWIHSLNVTQHNDSTLKTILPVFRQ